MAGPKRAAPKAPPPPQPSSSDDSSSSDGEMELKPRHPQPILAASPGQKKPPPPENPTEDGSDESDDEEESDEENEAGFDLDAREKKVEQNPNNAWPPQPPLALLPPPKQLALESGSSSGDESDSDEEIHISGLRSPNPAIKPISSKPMDEPLVKPKKPSSPPVAANNKKKQVKLERAPPSQKPEPPASAANNKKQVKREREPSSQKPPPVKIPKLEETSGSYKFLKDAINSLEDDGMRSLAANHLMKLLGDSEAMALDEKCKQVWFAEMKAKAKRMGIMKVIVSTLTKALAKSP